MADLEEKIEDLEATRDKMNVDAEVHRGKRDELNDAARAFAEQAFAVLLWSLIAFVIVVEIAMPWIMVAFAPGFLSTPDKFDLTVYLTRVTFPYLLFVSLVSLLGGVLNSLGRFAAAAGTPALLNVCLIGAVLWLAPFTATPGHALAWGVAAAGVLQFVWLFVVCGREGVWIRPRWPRLTPAVRQLIRRIVPVAFGAGIYQINLVVDMVIASLLPSGSISYLFYADRVNQLPLGVVGVAVGTALLPTLSRQVRADNVAAAHDSQNRAIEFALLLTLPAAAALAMIAYPVISVLFERGAFGAAEVKATAAALAVYALGLPAYVLVKALAPSFFARQDTATPVKISAVCMVVNLVLNLILMVPFLHVGIAMATAVSSWLNAGLMAYVLVKRGHLKRDQRLKTRLPRMAIASAGMAGLLFLLESALAGPLDGGEAQRVLALAVLVAAGLASFALLAQLTGAASARDLKGLFRAQAAE